MCDLESVFGKHVSKECKRVACQLEFITRVYYIFEIFYGTHYLVVAFLRHQKNFMGDAIP